MSDAAMTFSNLLKDSLHIFAQHWRVLISVALVFSIIPAAIMSGAYLIYYEGIPPEQLTMWDILMSAASWLLSILLTLSVVEFLRARNRTLTHSLRAGLRRFLDGFALTIVMTLALLFLFMLLIIPGIIFSVYWAFAYYALIMDEKGIIGSLKHSMSVVRGNWWRVLGYSLLVFLLIIIVSLFIIIPVVLIGAGLFFISPLAGALLIMCFSTALNALALVYVLIFFERMYVALR